MPTTAFLHTHVLVVALFLLLFTAKAVLLLLHKPHALAIARKSTRILDVVFGTLILVTGGYLLWQYSGGLPTWLLVKITLVLLAIPAGILGLRRESKALTVLALLLFAYVYAVADTKSLALEPVGAKAPVALAADTPETDAAETSDITQRETRVAHEQIISALSDTQLANARAIYAQACASCHGAAGAKGGGGATDLTSSTLSLNDRKHVMEKGRGRMPAFSSQLSEQEMEMVAAYTLTLKN